MIWFPYVLIFVFSILVYLSAILMISFGERYTNIALYYTKPYTFAAPCILHTSQHN